MASAWRKLFDLICRKKWPYCQIIGGKRKDLFLNGYMRHAIDTIFYLIFPIILKSTSLLNACSLWVVSLRHEFLWLVGSNPGSKHTFIWLVWLCSCLLATLQNCGGSKLAFFFWIFYLYCFYNSPFLLSGQRAERNFMSTQGLGKEPTMGFHTYYAH